MPGQVGEAGPGGAAKVQEGGGRSLPPGTLPDPIQGKGPVQGWALLGQEGELWAVCSVPGTGRFVW